MCSRWIPDDALVDTVVSVLANENPSVLIYTTTPPAPAPHSHEKAYEMDDPFPSSLHTDLKRDLGQHARQDSDRGEDLQAGLPLFERYNFLSQGNLRNNPLALGRSAIY